MPFDNLTFDNLNADGMRTGDFGNNRNPGGGTSMTPLLYKGQQNNLSTSQAQSQPMHSITRKIILKWTSN
jgi:hypothetical protein